MNLRFNCRNCVGGKTKRKKKKHTFSGTKNPRSGNSGLQCRIFDQPPRVQENIPRPNFLLDPLVPLLLLHRFPHLRVEWMVVASHILSGISSKLDHDDILLILYSYISYMGYTDHMFTAPKKKKNNQKQSALFIQKTIAHLSKHCSLSSIVH